MEVYFRVDATLFANSSMNHKINVSRVGCMYCDVRANYRISYRITTYLSRGQFKNDVIFFAFIQTANLHQTLISKFSYGSINCILQSDASCVLLHKQLIQKLLNP